MREVFKEEEKQRTILKPVDFTGIALHTGERVDIRFLPAEVDTGIVFRRTDLPQNPEISAGPDRVISTRRCTSIGKNEEKVVHTIEHIMAALWACAVDNIIIEVSGPEPPVADGSARPYIDLLKETGFRELSVPRQIWSVEKALWVRENEMYIAVFPYDKFKITYTLDYDHPAIGTQFFEFEGDRNYFIEEIASARTFGFKREVEALHKRGLALGGNLDNAVLIGKETTINSLRYPDEFVRHKILDLVGDMYLNGVLRGHIISVRSGHSLNVELASCIKRSFSNNCEYSQI